mgnify:FL=1
MKKVIYLLYFILLMILYHFTRNTNIFLLTISFSLLLLFNSIFSTMNIKNKIQEYYDNKYYYSNKKILKGSIIFIGIITIILMLISYLIGLLINIKGITLVNISMCIYIFTNNIIKLESEYFSIEKYKKLGNNLINVYKITNIILTIITIIILYKVLNLDNYINISILYLISLLPFIIFNLLFYFIIFKNNKCSKKREENKINYIKVIKKSIITNKIKVLYSIITSSYFYTSIIMLYFLLINKYNYTYDVVGTYITNTYLYGLIIIYFIYLFIKNNYIDKFNMLLDKIKNKEDYNIYNFINKITNVTLSITILLIIISKPLNNIIFNNEINIILNVSYILFFYILYSIIIKISMICNKSKNIFITLLIGLIISIITNIPIINSSYRMGYDMASGSLISIILGFIISTIIGIILINKKLKLSLINNFNDILNIIYENIIYSLILILFTFIIKVNVTSITKSILVIIFYIFITIIFYIIKRKIINKRVQ